MLIGGLEKLSLLDYPNNLAAIVFTQGCNFRCHFCYNPMLVWPRSEKLAPDEKDKDKGYPLIQEDDLFLFLQKRLGKIDGVVITGGEPTLHADLPSFIKKIKAMGYLVKLDTNGTNSLMLETLFSEKLVDYIAMDIKAPWPKYEKVVGVPVNLENLQKSVKIIMSSGLPYEFRSTLLPDLHDANDVEDMGKMIQGAERWYLQKFKSDTNLVNADFEGKNTFLDKELKELALIGSKFVKECRARV
ncbi:MAG TPA: anaerobic ribonucleoside-triphosphate reductase activating protein [bacterium]|nr:anaerobic ribonucleoside-triphosphate reductase activating protein [bacterium]HQQ37986.1 anaerobic ribonucleoside-triphosphate reductase activating protein [bacterium]